MIEFESCADVWNFPEYRQIRCPRHLFGLVRSNCVALSALRGDAIKWIQHRACLDWIIHYEPRCTYAVFIWWLVADANFDGWNPSKYIQYMRLKCIAIHVTSTMHIHACCLWCITIRIRASAACYGWHAVAWFVFVRELVFQHAGGTGCQIMMSMLSEQLVYVRIGNVVHVFSGMTIFSMWYVCLCFSRHGMFIWHAVNTQRRVGGDIIWLSSKGHYYDSIMIHIEKQFGKKNTI